MKKLLSLFVLASFLWLLGHFEAIAQTTVSGQVTDSETGEGLIGVNIAIQGKVVGTITDADGNFSLSTSTPPPFTLVISSIGYLGQQIEVTGNQSGIQIQLEEQTIQGQEVVVSASRVEESVLQSPVTIEKMDILSIQQSPGASFYDNIKNLKGVDISKQSLTFTSVTTRGFSSNGNVRLNQLIDGIDNAAPGLNFSAGNVVGISELDLESVELLPGASSALYGSGGTNGALLMTSKSPFEYQGFSAYVKGGVNHINDRAIDAQPFYDVGFRYAKAFNDRFAFKVNVSFLDAEDWQADDFRDRSDIDNPANFDRNRLTNPNPGYDGVNIYGDEVAASLNAVAQSLEGLGVLPPGTSALIPDTRVSRTGYSDEELVDYDSRSLKLNASLHYRVSENVELIGQVNYGFGTTVYTANSRNSLSNFKLTQAKLEARGSNFFARFWTTQERSGDSYDAVNLGVNLNRVWKSDSQWFGEYTGAFAQAALGGASEAQAHIIARQVADVGRLEPGSAEFNRAADSLEVLPINAGGALFTDKSNLYTFEAMYNFSEVIDPSVLEIIVGGNYRLFELRSEGTLFDDAEEETGAIFINEFGFYTQLSKSIFNNRLKLTASSRFDKNENFDGRVTPRGAIVYSAGAERNHNLRFSVQTAFRFPTTQNQFINLPIPGFATLIGGLPRFTDSFQQNPAFEPSTLAAFAATGDLSQLQPVEVDEFKPERVLTYELGYKTLLGNKLYIDVYGYYSIFKDFLLGNQVVRQSVTPIDLSNPTSPSTQQGLLEILDPAAAGLSAEQVTFSYPINARGDVKSYGWGLSLDYQLPKGFKLGGNVYFDDIDEIGDIGDAQVQFNTPKWRTNLRFSNREVVDNLGFSIVWRWQDSFLWESAFGTGDISSFHTVDAQVSYKIKSLKTIVKVGAQNLLNNYYQTSFGNPRIGGIYFVSFTFDQFLN